MKGGWPSDARRRGDEHLDAFRNFMSDSVLHCPIHMLE
jgi:hypothetical protein